METVRLKNASPLVTLTAPTSASWPGCRRPNAVQQSLAEATVPPGARTMERTCTGEAEEIYLLPRRRIKGVMRSADEEHDDPCGRRG